MSRNDTTDHHRRRSSSSGYRDQNDDYYYNSRRDSGSGRRRSSDYYDDGTGSRADRAAYKTANAAHNVTRTAGHGIEHIAARGQGTVDIVRGAIGEMWDGLWGDKAGERKNFERVERGIQTVKYGRHAEPSDVAAPRRSRGSLSQVISEGSGGRRSSSREEERRSEADYREGYASGLAAAGRGGSTVQ